MLCRILAFLILFVPALVCRADELHLTDGKTLTGRFVAADHKLIVFRTSEGLVVKGRDEVRSIVLAEGTAGGAPAPGCPVCNPGVGAKPAPGSDPAVVTRPGATPPGTPGAVPGTPGGVAGGQPGGHCNWCGTKFGTGGKPGVAPVAGTGTAPARPPVPPAGVDTVDSLKLVRWTTVRRITNFPRGEGAKFISAARISADGSKIIFAASQGTFVINSDGSNLVRLNARYGHPVIDISADGRKVVWYENHREGYVANSDGSGKVRLPGDVYALAVRITADGSRVIALSGEYGGVLSCPADGSAKPVVVVSTKAVSKLHADENGNHWRANLDISADGSRLVFQFLQEAFASNGDGSGLRQVSQSNGKYTLKLVRVSADGRKIAWQNEDGKDSTVHVTDWDGGNRVSYAGMDVAACDSLQVSANGSGVAMGYGLRLMDAAKKEFYNALDYGSTPLPYGKAGMTSMTGDFRRGCLVIEGVESTDQGRPSQLIIVDINPSSLNGAPQIGRMSVSPTFVKTDGSSFALITAQVTDPEAACVGTLGLRNGTRLDGERSEWALRDEGQYGDQKAKDGVYSSNDLKLGRDGKTLPGPFLLRYMAANQAGHALLCDVEAVEARP